jgi:aminoglycoside 9-adenylyltransferase
MNNKEIPKEAIQASKIIEELLDSILVGIYLYGSAVMGGLRINSDVDILVVINRSLSERTRRDLTDRLMLISGKIGNTKDMRPLEVTVINQKDIVFCKPFFPVFANFPCNNPAREFMRSLSSMIS